jgi:hypothetical protein
MIVMNKVGQKVICILTVLVIMTSTVLGTVNASVFHPHGNFSKNGIDDLPWAKFKNIANDYADDLGKLGKKELNYLKELSDHAGKLDNAILKNLELPAGFKPTDLPTNKLDNVIESAKYEKIDIEQIRKTYGEGILEDSDDILFAVNNPCAILGRGYNIFPIAYASGCKLPVDEWDGVKFDRNGRYREDLSNSFEEDEIADIIIKHPNFPKGFEANHQFPIALAKHYPELASAWAKKNGVVDLNNPKVMNFMTPETNKKHYYFIKEELSKLTNPTDPKLFDEILEKFKNSGIVDYSNVYYPR